jgi:hypothetical protein
MNVNGRLTAPPLFEAELVTNSVYGKVFAGGSFNPAARGIPLETSLLGSSAPPRAEWLGRQRSRFWIPFAVAATQVLSHPGEAAA